MAIRADAAIDRRAALERPAGSFGIAPLGDKPGMVDLLLVGRRRRPGEERRIGLERRGSVRAPVCHRFEIRHEIQKLPPARQQIGKPGWHQRHGQVAAIVDRGFVDDELGARRRGVAQHKLRRGLADDKPSGAPAVMIDDRHAPILRAHDLRRLEE